MTGRIDRLRDVLEQQQLDGIWITASENRRYLSGFTGSAGSLLVSAQAVPLVSDFRYEHQAAIESPAWTFHLSTTARSTGTSPDRTACCRKACASWASRRQVRVWALSVNLPRHWRHMSPNTELVMVAGLIEEIRAIKEAERDGGT